MECLDVPPILDEFEDLGRSAAEIGAEVVPSGAVVGLARYDLDRADALDLDDLTRNMVGFLLSTNRNRGLFVLQRRCEDIDALRPHFIQRRDMVARCVATDDIVTLFLDRRNMLAAVVRGIEDDDESRSNRELERRDDLLDGDLRFFLNGCSKFGARSSGMYMRTR